MPKNNNMDKLTMNMEVLGARLKAVRTILDLTQSEVAQRTGEKQVSVTRLEGGGSIGTNVLIKFLGFYSQYVSLDIVFDDKAWGVAVQEPEMLIRKSHINSIVNEKLSIMKENMIKNINEVKNEMNRAINKLENYTKRGMDSAISFTE